MAKLDYIKNKDVEFSTQLTTFKTNIGSYATTVGVSAGQVTAQAADADYFAYTLACQDIMSKGSQQWTAWKLLIREGGSPPALGMPVDPTFPTTVAPVAPGVEVRFRALVKQIKGHAAYNTSIGEALGIEGSAQAGPNLATLKPVLKLELSAAGVNVLWGWEGNSAFLDMLELCVDRGDGHGFVMLAFDTTPNYLDTTPYPATAAKWVYKGVFRVADQRVGLWSDEVSITVVA